MISQVYLKHDSNLQKGLSYLFLSWNDVRKKSVDAL